MHDGPDEAGGIAEFCKKKGLEFQRDFAAAGEGVKELVRGIGTRWIRFPKEMMDDEEAEAEEQMRLMRQRIRRALKSWTRRKYRGMMRVPKQDFVKN